MTRDDERSERVNMAAGEVQASREQLQARIQQLERLVELGLAWVVEAPADQGGVGPPAAGRGIASTNGAGMAELQAEIRRLELMIAALAELESRRHDADPLESSPRHATPRLPDSPPSANGSGPPNPAAARWDAQHRAGPVDHQPGQPEPEPASAGAPISPATSASTGARARRWGSELFQFVLLTVVGVLMFRSAIQTFRVDGPSMLPTFHSGQILLINRAAYFHVDGTPFERLIPTQRQGSIAWVFGGVRRGDIVIFRTPTQRNTDYVKRVIGLPGDAILVLDGQVYVNDQALDEPYALPDDESYPDDNVPLVVPDGMYFVLGDNRPASGDSRQGWLLPVDNIVGRAWLSVWPPGAWGVVERASTPP